MMVGSQENDNYCVLQVFAPKGKHTGRKADKLCRNFLLTFQILPVICTSLSSASQVLAALICTSPAVFLAVLQEVADLATASPFDESRTLQSRFAS